MADLVYRHNRVTRITHWVNVLALPILFMSGLQIFNAFPELHWGNKAEPGAALVTISSTSKGNMVQGFVQVFGRRFDTTGFLGVQYTRTGPDAQAFPGWLTIPSYFWLAGGRQWHFFFGWVFALNGLIYVIFNLVNGHMRKFFLTLKDAADIPAMIAYYLHWRKESPQEGEYNPLQKMAYTSVFVILAPLIALSGMAMSPQLDTAYHWLPAVFGGRQAARTVHFLLAFGFASFVFGHVFMVSTQGFFNNMRSMITGWYNEKVPSREEPLPVRTAPVSLPEAVSQSEQANQKDSLAATVPEENTLPEPTDTAPLEKNEGPKDAETKIK